MKSILTFIIFFSLQSLWAQNRGQFERDKTLKQTQDLLRNPQQRDSFIRGNEGAQKVDDNVKSLTGGNEAYTAEMYNIAADVLALVTERAKKPNGEIDVEKMKRLMMEYQTNPEAFYRQMTPEQRQRIKELGKKIGPAPASQN